MTANSEAMASAAKSMEALTAALKTMANDADAKTSPQGSKTAQNKVGDMYSIRECVYVYRETCIV